MAVGTVVNDEDEEVFLGNMAQNGGYTLSEGLHDASHNVWDGLLIQAFVYSVEGVSGIDDLRRSRRVASGFHSRHSR